MKTFIRLAVLSLACLGGGVASATEALTRLNVTINVVGACEIEMPMPTDVDFGSADILQRDIVSTAYITVICTPGVAYQIGLDDGQNFSNGRRMKALYGNDTIAYELYESTAMTQRWGLVDTPYSRAGTGSGMGEIVPVYGKVPTIGNVRIGRYADRVVVTLKY